MIRTDETCSSSFVIGCGFALILTRKLNNSSRPSSLLNGKDHIGLWSRWALLNYRVVKEDTGEDMRIVHVSRLKACYPSAEELEAIERRKVLDIFEEESEETFLGFPDPEVSHLKACDSSAEERELQKVMNLFVEESDEETFLGFPDQDVPSRAMVGFFQGRGCVTALNFSEPSQCSSFQ